ncbi:MAG: response regulator [bacterium]|nr:response regulator [bacterium]
MDTEDAEKNADQKLIILIEDEKIISSLLTKKLEEAGYAVKVAPNGIEGIQLVKKSHPALLLLDMMLPGRDGFWVMEELGRQAIMPALPVVIISNSGQPVEIERALRLGARDYLVKVNFDPQEVLVKIKTVLSTPVPVAAPPPMNQEPSRVLSPQSDALAMTGGDPLRNAHLLVIEDDLFILEMLKTKLEQAAGKVSIAHDTDEGMKILTAGPVDLLLLDILLPKKDGFAFLKELKASPEYKTIPVLILSNLGQKEERERGLALGAVDYIIKADSSPIEIINRSREVLKHLAEQNR